MANLWIKKPLSELMKESEDTDEKGLKRSLTATSLVMIGIGAIIGAGLFVRTASAAANHAGPAVTYSFIIAAIGCALAGLCYAEFASMIPIAGSAYTYSYATMGELVAWIIGWDLVLEYGLGAATVSVAWSEYLNKLLSYFGYSIPYQWCHSPFEHSTGGTSGIINIPAVFILCVLTWILIRGIQESANVNAVIVLVKVTIVLLFIGFGWQYINGANHVPYIPEVTQFNGHSFGGWGGILTGAGVVFFAFIGFDAVSTTAQESKNPKRDMPIGILGSLVVCTVLYILFSHVLTGIAPYTEFRGEGKEASVAYAIKTHMPASFDWLGKFVTVAILFGFSSVMLVMLLGQSRVFYSMSNDGLVPKVFSELHPKYRTPAKSNLMFLVLSGLFAAFIPGDVVGDMTSIGTLFAFVLVCAGIIILRVKNPDVERPFKTPLVWFVAPAGALVCLLMIGGLGYMNWLRLLVWLAIGFVIYFGYSIKNSKMQNGINIYGKGYDSEKTS
jgi:basic amino acid/polyamine antiporter, APA family